jgi:hypothetical protein
MKCNPFPLLILFLFTACHQGSSVSDVSHNDTISFPNVSLFLQEQLKKMDAPTLYETHNGKSDTTPITTADVQKMLSVFMSPDQGAGQYTRTMLPDSAHHRTIISFEAEGDSVALSRVDVFLDETSRDITQLYLQYFAPGTASQTQLLWKTDSTFTLIQTQDKGQYTSDLQKQTVVWKKP